MPSPGQTTPLQPVAADGKAVRQGVMAFKSPSMDELLWLDRGAGLALADQAAMGAWINRILSAVESFK